MNTKTTEEIHLAPKVAGSLSSRVIDDYMAETYHKCGDPLNWEGLYSGEKKFKKYLSAETNAHPAKMSMLLADKIVRHLEGLGLLKQSDTIIDFMAGTARTGVVAELHGHSFIGVELEDHFIGMQNLNRIQIEKKLHRAPSWQLLQGDARNLSKLLKEKGVGIVSPPYADAMNSKQNGIDTSKYKDQARAKRANSPETLKYNYAGITSPPYSEADKQKKRDAELKGEIKRHMNYTYKKSNSGSEKQNIGNLKDNLVGLTSPPYHKTGNKIPSGSITEHKNKTGEWRTGLKYSDSPSTEQLGTLKEESYLSAMLQVYTEAFKSGISPLVTVTKNPTRKGKLRRLDVDTAELLIRAGYQIVDYHRALLFSEGSQFSLAGTKKKRYNGRLSFFKRLSAEKGNVVAKFEDIIIAVIA